MKKPNILLIMADQMRQDVLSSGCGTPALDRLAENGTLFTGCVTPSPICAPARASMLLGCYPSRLGVLDNSPHIVDADRPNWVKALRDAGYSTSVFGKTHYYAYNGSYPDMRRMEGYLRQLGYDAADEVPGPRVCGRLLSHMTALWAEKGLIEPYREDLKSRYGRDQAVVRPSIIPFELHPDVYPARRAAEYLRSYDEDRPFFMFLSFPGPHDPWDCPAEYRKRYPSCAAAKPLGPMHDVSPDRPRGIFDEPLEYDPPSEEEVAEIRMDYAAHVRMIDDMIASVLDVLRERGMADDTVIAFTSDHGEMLGDFGRLYKGNFLRSAVSVPLILSGTGISRGTDSRLCTLFDVGRTLAEIAGADVDDEGISLTGNARRGIVFSEYRDECMAYDGRWKLSLNGRDEAYQLFDTLRNPDETENLASSGCEAEDRLRAEALRHKEECHAEA